MLSCAMYDNVAGESAKIDVVNSSLDYLNGRENLLFLFLVFICVLGFAGTIWLGFSRGIWFIPPLNKFPFPILTLLLLFVVIMSLNTTIEIRRSNIERIIREKHEAFLERLRNT